MNSLKSVASLLQDQNGSLYHLLLRAARLQSATALLRGHLAAPLNRYCQVANIKDEVLLVHADSSVWASRLRFQVGAIAECFNASGEFGEIVTVCVRVNPDNLP